MSDVRVAARDGAVEAARVLVRAALGRLADAASVATPAAVAVAERREQMLAVEGGSASWSAMVSEAAAGIPDGNARAMFVRLACE